MSLDGYEVRETIAQSPRTIVRRALRKWDGAKVVIKSLTREYPAAHEIGQLEFEYRILRKLTAPGAIRALDLEKEGDRLAMVLEDFGGENLPSGAAGGLPLDRFFPIAIAITKTLGQIHGQNIIHKDIKPQNILINPSSREVKLIDFNIASELLQEYQDVSLANQLEGSLPYISPEQTGRMNRDLDYRTDYYSLGITFFEMLTGALPFTATDMMGWIHCHISKAVPNLRDVKPALPEALAQIVRKLMAKNPDDRYQSARGLLHDLESCRSSCAPEDGTAPRGAGETPSVFRLGEHDLSDRFQVSQKLFGREEDADALLDAFQTASRGASKLLLVAGYSGVGKSSLIREIQKSIVSRRGKFISGKFDQLERNVPYGALVQALRGLVRQILAEPEAQLRAWRQRLGAALGANGQVLIDLIPELGQVVGPQPPAPSLSARETHGRFQRVFRELIRACAQPEHPLVIFLDDLQWTDASTPELLVHLLGTEELRHLLIIGAYRDNEVKEGHLLLLSLKELQDRRPDAVLRIQLQPLSETSVNQLIADTLHCDPAASRPLASLIFQKTAGNPFFINELLTVLHRDGAFQFVAADGRWQWDLEQIAGAAVSDNVVDLMVQRLRRLPAETIEYLCLAACIGNRFDLRTMVRVAERPAGVIAAALWEAVRQRVLMPLGSRYRLIDDHHDYDQEGLTALDVQYQFQHDRVQQAADSLLDEGQRARIHHKIGRLLWAASGKAEREEKLFEIVNHLNLGQALVTTLEERTELAELNCAAGQRARRSAAYAIAAKYLGTCLDLLAAGEGSVQPARGFELRRTYVECVFLAGDVERAGALGDELLASAPDRLSGAAAHYLKAGILEHQGALQEAVDTIRRGLRLLNVELPDDHAEIDRGIGAGIAKMQEHLARTPIEDFVHLPELGDPEKIMLTNLLFQLIPPAIQTYPPLFVLAELMMFDLALTHGTTAASCKNFVDCGIIQGGILGDYPGAYRLGKVAFALLERYAPTPLESGVNFVFGAFVSHWRAHHDESFEAFAKAQRVGLEMGDIQHTAYAHAHRVMRLLAVGRELGECHEETERAVAYLGQVHAVNQLVGAAIVQRALAQLRGMPLDSAVARASDDEFTERVRQSHNAQWLYLYGQSQSKVSFLLGDLAAAERWNDFAAPYLPAGNGLFFGPEHLLIHSLILAQRGRTESEAGRAAILETLVAHQTKLKIWADNSPANFEHNYMLASAEIARLRDAPLEEVIALYDQAIAATGNSFIHMKALANELQADFWLEKQRPKIARTFLQEAYYLYRRWGAHAKLRQLERKFPEWLQTSSEGATELTTGTIFRDTVGESSLDLASVIKATQAISSEMKPERLFAKLMATIIENAGAQRGCLIFKAEPGDQLYVEAKAHVGDEAQAPARSQPIEECDELCPEIVRYVARTADTVVVDDASHHETYRADAYVQKNGIKSVLCMPVMNQGRLVALLYVENNAATHAFTPQRLSLLQVIASQAAISITNARLYDSLEEKVAERTRELGDRNREVAAMLNSMRQGVFTIDENLVIQPRYSDHLERLLGRRDVAGQDCLQMLFRDSNVGPDALDAMRSALQFSFGFPLFVAEANAGHLVQELHRTSADGERRSFEVDWSFIVGEEGDVGRVLVALRDVTLIRQLNETVAEKARELDIVGQILDAGLDDFQEFCASARGFAQEIKSILVSGAPLTSETLGLLFRNMHTIKGTARLLGLSHLVDAAHLAEDSYDQLRRNLEVAPDLRQLIAGVDTVLAAIEEHELVCHRKLGGLTRGHNVRLDQELSEIEAVVKDVTSGSVNPAQALRDIQSAINRAHAVPLAELVENSARMLPSLARELHKSPPVVCCDDAGLMLSPTWGAIMKDVLVHGLRNALDHGIEDQDERQAKGKPPQGRITIRLDRLEAGTRIRLFDDGRGLPLDALRERIGDPRSSDQEVAERAFQSGITTAARLSSVSGRGVGLDAIRSFVRREGGNARIVFSAESQGGFRPFELVFDLPEDAVPHAWLAAPPDDVSRPLPDLLPARAEQSPESTP